MRDDYASRTRPVKELKAFTRVSLAPGETKTIKLHVDQEQLKFWKDGQWIVEPGTFTVMVDKLFDTVTL
jgi:beta-glucosidase